MLYPCLSRIEDNAQPLATVLVLEGDAVRLAGACFVALTISSLGLWIPLLPCCQHGESDTSLSNYFFLRTLLFLQGSFALCLIAVGLINLESSDDEDTYSQPGKGHSPHCSSLRDQTVLWMGVGMFCLVSFGLMASFWPTTATTTTSSAVNNRQRKRRWLRCCCQGKTTTPQQIESTPSLENNLDMEEPLLQSESTPSLTTLGGTRAALVASPCTVPDEEDISVPSGVVFQRSEGSGEEHNNYEQSTSRLRGTSRLLKLAGNESMYLWIGIAVLLVRLPFSLAIPHFVSTTIASLIDEDYNGAKREVLLLFLIGTVDAALDFWCIFLFGKAKENIVRTIREDTFASILRQEHAFFDRTNTGDLLSRLTSDCGEMAGDLTWFFRFSIEALVRITG